MTEPFPTPDELDAQHRQDLEPDVVRLRELVKAAFKGGPNAHGEYIVSEPSSDPIAPDAYKVVGEELRRSRWATRQDHSFATSGWVIYRLVQKD